MKKICALILVFVLISSFQSVYARDDITVTINGYIVVFDVPPQIINGRTMVPMRRIFESLGANVNWVEEKSLVVATYKTSIITMPIGETSFSVTDVLTNETRVVEIDVAPMIIDGRTLVPARAVSEAIGKTVNWNGDTRTVIITDEAENKND